MRVDLPAPFSPMRACTSPGSSRNATSSSALTPGKLTHMSRISTTGAGGSSVKVDAMDSLSVLAIRQGRDGLLLIKCLVGYDDTRRHGLAGLHLLGQVHQLRSEQWVALDEVVELAVGQSLHAVV